MFAVFVEGLIEYIFDNGNTTKSQPYLKYIALAAGIIVAAVFNLDGLNVVFAITSPVPFAGVVITGLVIGRGSNYVNDFFGKFASRNNTAAKKESFVAQPVIREDLQING